MTHVERLFALEQFGIKLGLEAMRVLLAALDHPEARWPAVHVAGTNGKGSVTAMVDTALRAAGWRVGRYTSPHLVRIEERVVVDGAAVSPAILEAALGRVFAAVDALVAAGRLSAVPTFFEVSTAAAFVVFADAAVDVSVVEVGLGGRYDATNVIRPAVAAITSIAFDHERHLGSTLAAIAAEKAGIAKPGVPLVVGPLAVEPMAVVREAAARAGAPLVAVDDEVTLAAAADAGHAVVTITTPVRRYPAVRLGLAGRHQVANAAVAVRSLEVLSAATAVRVEAGHVMAGLRDVRWPARLEWLRRRGGGARLLLDAAHNPAGARALASYLAEADVGPVTLVTSIMRDKDAGGILAPLLPQLRRVVATRADTPRARTAAELAAAVAAIDRGLEVVAIEDPWQAVQTAIAAGEPVVVAGSIFLAGPLREALLAGGGFEPA
ncbi:MAG: folylpolyglutamate synthase/dihydrofolate synthase family protein [Vicinamibacterales bacterium]